MLPGASVRARRGVQEFTGTTDALGEVTFPDLLPGSYQISVLRILTDAERALLPPEDADVDAFGGGVSLSLGPPEATVLLTARATRRGSLVIAEVFPATRLPNNEFPVIINEVFDSGPAFVTTAAVFMSIRRQALGTVLLRSGSTVNDFEVVAAPTPGAIP